MKLIDRYIIQKFLSTFLFVMLILVAIIVVIDYTEHNDKFVKNDVSGEEILGYYFSFIPFIANLITPITVFIATVFVTSKMAGHTEIIAILSSGVSFKRMMLPFLVGATIISLVTLYMNGWVIPDANKTRINFQINYFRQPKFFSERDIHMKVAPTSYAYMESYNNRTNSGFRFTLETIENGEVKEKLSALRIKWDSTDANWKLEKWKYVKIMADHEETETGERMDTTINIHPRDFSNISGLHETLTNAELNDYIAQLKLRGDDGIAIYLIEKYVRFMTPFSAIILTFIGVIVSARKTRGGTGFQIALGFLLAFIYIIFFIMARAIAESSNINPIIGVWIPNIVFSILGAVMYKTVPR
ncbi:MAG: LptF/LptG family permease [Bacteroidota bacterium]